VTSVAVRSAEAEAEAAGAPVRPTAERVEEPFDATSAVCAARSTQEAEHW